MSASLISPRGSARSAALWLLPLVALLAYGAWMTDFGRKLFGEDVAWRKVNAMAGGSGVVPDIAFNADASPYAVVTDRNLFVPWRKPAPPPEPPKAAPEPPKPQIRRGVYALTGTMQIGESVVATVRETATNRTKQVRAGELLQEYTVQKIDMDRVVLAFAGQEEELVLARYTQSGRATAPPAVAVAQPVPSVPGAVPVPSAQMPGGVPGGIPPRIAPLPQQNTGGLAPFPPSGTNQAMPVAPQPAAVATTPVAQPPAPEVIDVGELLRRRREARKQ